MTVIKPTVGRKVWFRHNGETIQDLWSLDPVTPMDATVIYVYGDRCVNLSVIDHVGKMRTLTSVQLVQPDDAPPSTGCYACWMPFQAGQARGDRPKNVEAFPIMIPASGCSVSRIPSPPARPPISFINTSANL